MSKKNQSFGVDLVETDGRTPVLVDNKEIGYIEKTTRGFAGYFGKQAVINQAKDEDEALQAILASFNLHQ